MNRKVIKKCIEDLVHKLNDKQSKVHKSYTVTISKINNDKQIAFGWAMISRTADGKMVKDLQDDCIDPEDLEDLAYRYVGLYGDVGQLHETEGEGRVVESIVFTQDKIKALGIPEGLLPIGWWIGLYIKNPEVWALVKDETYQAFSIEGRATREEVE